MNTLTAIGVVLAISLSAAVWAWGEQAESKMQIVVEGLKR